ncbi:hypothetical protein K3495_g8438 [Podosphaera aphanis]|nr:hypothetical protein K3495_g8438 [Podosphaera aphanis]
MAFLLQSTLVFLFAAIISGSTIKFDIGQNLAVRDAQLRRRAESVSLSKRDDNISVPLGNSLSQGLYFANVSVGTPPQTLALQVDTGSSDTWIPSSTAPLCGNAKDGGCPNGSFSAHRSNTFALVSANEFNISYVDGSGAMGDYFQDSFALGGFTLSNFEMGLARHTTIGTGIMGIGYNNSEANVNLRSGGNGTIYPNLPIALLNQNKIKSVAYSLWLNDLQSSSGSILFGGIDTAKYSGDLISVNVYPTSYRLGITSFTVAFTSLSATSSTGTDQLTPPNYAVPAILDSGTTITLLPDDVAELVFEELNATPEPRIGAVVVPCALAQNSGTLNYGFGGPGGPVIKVAVSDLVLPLTDSKGQSPKYNNGETACQLGIQAAGPLPVLFGDTFLRSAYVVYDLVNNRIALAQTDFNATDSNVVSFPGYGAPIPSAKTAVSEALVTQTISDIPKAGNTAKATATGLDNPDPTPVNTNLSAIGGFEATITSGSSATSKVNIAGAVLEPFAWTRAIVGALCLALMGVGSIFALL